MSLSNCIVKGRQLRSKFGNGNVKDVISFTYLVNVLFYSAILAHIFFLRNFFLAFLLFSEFLLKICWEEIAEEIFFSYFVLMADLEYEFGVYVYQANTLPTKLKISLKNLSFGVDVKL